MNQDNGWKDRELSLEEHINRIFERAHIPQWAHDAKIPILSLLTQARAEERKKVIAEISERIIVLNEVTTEAAKAQLNGAFLRAWLIAYGTARNDILKIISSLQSSSPIEESQPKNET